MSFKWNTRLPQLSHKIKSQDFEVSNRIYRIVIGAVKHSPFNEEVEETTINNIIAEDQNNKRNKLNMNLISIKETRKSLIHFMCLCGQGCAHNDNSRKNKFFFLGIEYRGNSYISIPTRISATIKSKNELKVEMIYSYSKYDEYYGEYLEIPCKEQGSDVALDNRLQVSISLSISPYKQSLIGIRNLGATCYINSLIQVLYWNDEFYKRIMSLDIFSTKEDEKSDTQKNGENEENSETKNENNSTSNLLKKEEKKRFKNLKTLQTLFYLLTPHVQNKGSDTQTERNKNHQEDSQPYLTTFNPVSYLQCSLLGPIHEHQDVHEWFKLLMDRIEGELKEYCTEKYETKEDEKSENHILKDKDTPSEVQNSGDKKQENKGSSAEKEANQSLLTKNYLNDLFDGKMSHIIQSSCGCISRREETFSEIEIDFFDCTESCPVNEKSAISINEISYKTSTDQNLSSEKGKHTHFTNSLTHSLSHHFAKEHLISPNQYFCEKHNSHFDAYKFIKIRKMPKNLIFIIKRFNMNWETMGVEKCDQEMQYSELVDMNDYMDDTPSENGLKRNSESLITLKSVIVHQGIPTDGHYYSYTKIKDNFYKFNDNQVNMTSKSEIFLHQKGGRHPYKGVTNDHSGYLLAYSILEKNDMLDQEVPLQNVKLTESSLKDEFSVSEIYSSRQVLHPQSLLDHFSILSYKISCTDPSKLIGYDGPGLFNYTPRYPTTQTVQLSIDELRGMGNSKQYHYIFGVISKNDQISKEKNDPEKYFLSCKITKHTNRIFSYYTNHPYDWSAENNIFILKKYVDVKREYHKSCAIYPTNRIKIIGVDIQTKSWTVGHEIMNEFSNENNEKQLAQSVILHKNNSEEIKSLLKYVKNRGLVTFRNGNKLLELFLEDDELWEDALKKYLRCDEIRVMSGQGFTEAYSYYNNMNVVPITQPEEKTIESQIGLNPTDHLRNSIEFFIPPSSMLLTISRGCLDYNKISHFHTIVVEKGLKVRKIVEKMKIKKLCIFDEFVLENKTLDENAKQSLNSERVLIKIEKCSFNIQIYRENDEIECCLPNDVFILQKINSSWTDYVVFTYTKNDELVGFPFLVYWNAEVVLEKYEQIKTDNKYSGIGNIMSNSTSSNKKVTWNMLRFQFNITDRVVLVENDTMRQVEGEEEVYSGSVCLLVR